MRGENTALPWAKLWGDVRKRVNARKNHALTLTVDEIRAMTGTDQNVDKPWWWELGANKTAIGSEPLAPHGLQGEPRVLDGKVYAVTFTLAENADNL